MLRRFNTEVFGRFPNATTMAEESTAWPLVSRPADVGGLGFGYKWNMGWMHDTLNYISRDPIYRRHHHGDVVFGLHYAFFENFVLPLSHDEVVHGKGSIIGRMPGDRWQKFANMRAYYTFMFGHPGKKLLFMGNEFAQESEWRHDHSLDWHLLGQREHRAVQDLVRDLNRIYRETPALHELDCEAHGFEWLVMDDTEQSVFAWLRRGRESGALCVMVVNFTPEVRRDYRIKVPVAGPWREVFNSDSERYGGSNVGNSGRVEAVDTEAGGELSLTLPPLAGIYLVPERT
jgi:1,4-alpha-glucan branching enzyme